MTQWFTRDGEEITLPANAEISKTGVRAEWIVKEDCHRCGGQGGSNAWAHTGWTCFACGGLAKVERVRKAWIREALDKMNARQDAKAAKAREEREERLLKAAMEQKHIVDAIAPHTDNHFLNDMLRLIVEEGRTLTEKQAAAALTSAAKMTERKAEQAERDALNLQSEWVGEAGDKLEANVKVERVSGFDNQWGWTNVITFRTDNGDVLCWMTSSFVELEAGQETKIKFTVKDHSTFRDTKQTKIIRVKEV